MRGNIIYHLLKFRSLPGRLRLKWWQHQPEPDDHFRSKAAPIVIGGSARSGTTLLRVMLDTYSQVCCGPESGLLIRPGAALGSRRVRRHLARSFGLDLQTITGLYDDGHSHTEFVDIFFSHYARSMGKSYWAEKTPANIRRVDYILDHFPDARIVHIIRDGRDAVCSLRNHPKRVKIGGRYLQSGVRRPFADCLTQWMSDIGRGLAHRGDQRYIEIRYEALVSNPQKTLEPLFKFLELLWEPDVLNFHRIKNNSRAAQHFPQNQEATQPINQTSTGRWRTCLSASEKVYVKNQADELLAELGYGNEPDWA